MQGRAIAAKDRSGYTSEISRQIATGAEKKDTSCIHALTDYVDESKFAEGEGDNHQRQWEFVEGEECSVKFSLKSSIKFWEEILKPSQFVLNVIRLFVATYKNTSHHLR